MTGQRLLASAVSACLVASLAGGCGRYALRRSHGPTTTTGNVSVGAGLTGHDDTATTAGTGPTTTTTVGAPTVTARAGTNRVTSDDSGLRFVFTVGNKTAYGEKEDISMDVTITNVSGHPLAYEPNQPRNFILGHPAGTTGSLWYDSDCDPRKPPGRSPALYLQPGAQLHLSALYPGPKTAANRELCRRPPDEYLAGALFALCDRIRDADQSCDPGSLHYAKSLGIRITIG